CWPMVFRSRRRRAPPRVISACWRARRMKASPATISTARSRAEPALSRCRFRVGRGLARVLDRREQPLPAIVAYERPEFAAFGGRFGIALLDLAGLPVAHHVDRRPLQGDRSVVAAAFTPRL